MGEFETILIRAISQKNKTKERLQMKKNQFVARGAIIAALYVVLTIGINAFGLASGAIQIRISEALTI